MRDKIKKKSGLSDPALLAISIVILVVGILLIFIYYGKLL
jgi:hypothetical protein